MGFALLTTSLYLLVSLTVASYGVPPSRATRLHKPEPIQPTVPTKSLAPAHEEPKQSTEDPHAAAARYWSARVAAGFPFDNIPAPHNSPIDNTVAEIKPSTHKIESASPAASPSDVIDDSESAPSGYGLPAQDTPIEKETEEKIEKTKPTTTTSASLSGYGVPPIEEDVKEKAIPEKTAVPSGYGVPAKDSPIEEVSEEKIEVAEPESEVEMPSGYGVPAKSPAVTAPMEEKTAPVPSIAAPVSSVYGVPVKEIPLNDESDNIDDVIPAEGSGYGTPLVEQTASEEVELSGEDVSSSAPTVNSYGYGAAGYIQKLKSTTTSAPSTAAESYEKIEEDSTTAAAAEPSLVDRAKSYGSAVLNAASQVESEMEHILTGAEQKETTTTHAVETTRPRLESRRFRDVLNRDAARAYWATATMPSTTSTQAAPQRDIPQAQVPEVESPSGYIMSNWEKNWEQKEQLMEKELEQLAEELVEAKAIYGQTHPKMEAAPKKPSTSYGY